MSASPRDGLAVTARSGQLRPILAWCGWPGRPTTTERTRSWNPSSTCYPSKKSRVTSPMDVTPNIAMSRDTSSLSNAMPLRTPISPATAAA